MKALIFIVIFVLTMALSWAITTGLIYAICALVGWNFSMAEATAIWLCMILLRGVFARGGKV